MMRIRVPDGAVVIACFTSAARVYRVDAATAA